MRAQKHRMARAQKIAQRRPVPNTAPVPLPSPYGGINSRDALDQMQPNDAIQMDNMWPTEGKVTTREGITESFDTGTEANVDFIYEHYVGGSRTCIVASNGSLYDLTSMTKRDSTTDGTTANHLIEAGVDFAAAGVTTDSIVINDTDGTYANVTAVAVGDLTLDADIMVSGDDYRVTTPLATGHSSDTWDAVAFDGDLILVNDNASDDIYFWDGTTLSTETSNYTGVSDAKDWSGVAEFKERLFFWTGRDQDFWYMDAAKAKTGLAVQFSLSRVNQFGGVLIDAHSWTVDGGDGMDDYMVFLMSSGEVVVYQGVDPGNAVEWGLVGIYKVAEPLGGVRAMTKVGGDLYLVCRADIIPMSTIFQRGYTGTNSKISGAVRSAAAVSTGYGWSITLHPEGNMLLINHPISGGMNQFVMNTITGAWARFVDLDGRSWGIYNSSLYMGDTAGKVHIFDGESDNGTAITCRVVTAWTDLGSPHEKHPTLAKPILSGTGAYNYEYKLGFDFVVAVPDSATEVASTGTAWGSPWGSPWSASVNVSTEWRAASGKGQFVNVSLNLSALQVISWLRTDLRGHITSNL